MTAAAPGGLGGHQEEGRAFPIIRAGSGGAKLERALGCARAAFDEIESDIPMRVVRFERS